MLTSLALLLTTLAGADTVLVSPGWLSAHLGDPGLVVVQVDRDRSGYDGGHIAGSRYLPLSALVVERDGIPNEMPALGVLDSVLESVGIGDESRVIITGEPLAAARLFFALDYLGHGDRAALLDGGNAGWVEAGYPLSGEVPPVTRGSFTIELETNRLVDLAWVRANLGVPGVVLLDARPAKDYTGTAGSTPPTGHIPGARSLPWQSTLGGSPPRLLQERRLLDLFRGAGVSRGDVVVTYCRSGMQASFLYFVARYLGYDVKMYDGSFAEWIRQPNAPVESGMPR